MAADLAFTINPRTLKLDVAVTAGEPSYDNSRLHKVMSRLAADRGKWWADTTGQRGSRLQEVKILRAAAASDLEAYAREALAPLVAGNEILPPSGESRIGVDVTLDRARGRALILVRWSAAGGGDQSTRFALGL